MKLQDFCKEHPNNYKELLQKPPYNLKIKEEDNFIIFNYDRISSDFSLPIVNEARGVILEKDNLNVVCFPFIRFYNYGEPNCVNLNWKDGVKVLEKVDGSLMKIWYWKGNWHLSTNGMINAFSVSTGNLKYKTFGNLFERALKEYGFKDLNDFCHNKSTDFTYMFELATEDNRIVIPYTGYHIYYLGQRNMKDYYEYKCNQNWEIEFPKIYELNTLNDIINSAKELPYDEEGYVVVDNNWNRCKIKSPAYIRAHYMRNNNVITKSKLINIILENEINEFCVYASEYKDELFKLQQEMNNIELVANQCLEQLKQYKKLSKKDFAQKVNLLNYNMLKDFCFKNYDENLSWKDYTSNWSSTKWEKILNYFE